MQLYQMLSLFQLVVILFYFSAKMGKKHTQRNTYSYNIHSRFTKQNNVPNKKESKENIARLYIMNIYVVDIALVTILRECF